MNEERDALSREIQACTVRLDLMPPFGQEPRMETFRDELQQRRDDAAARLAQIDATLRQLRTG